MNKRMILGALALILSLCVLVSPYALADSDNSENSITLGDQSLADGTVLSDDGKTLITAPSNAVNYVIPDTVETVAGYAFFKCSNMQSITFPESVKTLEAHTFDGLGLITVYVPKDVPYMSSIPPFFNIVSAGGESYTVTFESNGGSEVASQIVNDGENAVKPADPTKQGYVFGGWYSNAELTTEHTFTTPVTADITLYAKWYIELAFSTSPSIQNVTVTVDGRTITATATAENFEYLLWDMGDGSEPVKTYTNSIAYTYSSDGDYAVKVTAYNSKGQSETISQDVSVSEGNSDKSNDQNGGKFSTFTIAGIILIVLGAILTIISLIRFNPRILKPGLILIVAGIITAIFGGFL